MDFKKLKRCFIIAEISANHGQSFKKAVALIKKAKECGVDAVKFQAYTPDTLTIDVNNKHFKIIHPKWGGRTLYSLYKQAYTPWKWFKELKRTAEDLGLVFFATAFDKTSVDFLEELGVSLHKIASFELVDLPLIEYAAKTKKSLVMSTGMALCHEIRSAINTARNAGAKDIALLKCVSSYPADPRDMNLATIGDMRKKFGCPVGISDHTLGLGVAVAAVSLGAQIIEKHFTQSRKVKTPDSFFSMEPEELKLLVENVRIAEDALGTVHYGLTAEEKNNRLFRRSLFVVKDIKKGEGFTSENVRSIRPGYGLPPKYLKNVLGRKAAKDLKRGIPLTRDFVR